MLAFYIWEKNKMMYSRKTERQIEVLEDSIQFDRNKKLASVPLHYDSVEDLFDSRKGYGCVSTKTVAYLHSIINKIPSVFKVNFDLSIDDYGSVNKQSLLESLKSSVEDDYYTQYKSKRSKNVLLATFPLIAILIIIIQFFAEDYSWFGASSSFLSIVMLAMCELFSEIFFEESLIFLFINESSFSLLRNRVKRLYNFSITTNDAKYNVSVDKNNFFTLHKSYVYVSRYILFYPIIIFALTFLLLVFEINLITVSLCVLALLIIAENFYIYTVENFSLKTKLVLPVIFIGLSFYYMINAQTNILLICIINIVFLVIDVVIINVWHKWNS